MMTLPNEPISFADFIGAPAVGTVLCNISELEKISGKELRTQSGDNLFSVFIIMYNDDIYAYVNKCPHTGSPLNLYKGQFLTSDNSAIACSTHGARFDPTSGVCVSGPCLNDQLVSLAITINHGDVIAA